MHFDIEKSKNGIHVNHGQKHIWNIWYCRILQLSQLAVLDDDDKISILE